MKSKFKGFGTFEGVFTPTILTIVGVIMYLRLGWVVGNQGLTKALLIILLAKVVTVTTSFSIASIATNVKIGAGGSYALISRSLGLEIGSAIGIPLYLSQVLGGALYITGFTIAFESVFPCTIEALKPYYTPLVSSCVLLVLFAISIISARFAMKVQYVIMAIIGLSLVSLFMGQDVSEATEIQLNAAEVARNVPFWAVFAVFFPAVTGIEAGAAMSGDLQNPGRSLSIGIMSAVGISLVIYLFAAYWLDGHATAEQLKGCETIMSYISRWKILIVGGMFAATLSSALGSIVGGPRTLMALGEDKVIPFSRLMAKKSANGEPRIAIVVSTILIWLGIVGGDLDGIATLLTMFFLITYGTINLAVLIEKGTGIPSFRPSFNLPIIIPLIGSVWCFAVMFLINKLFASVAILVLLLLYVIQVRRHLETSFGDVRSAFFLALAEWSTKIAGALPKTPKTWKPNYMIPIEDPKHARHVLDFIKDISFPSGTVRMFSVKVVPEGIKNKLEGITSLYLKKGKENVDIANSTVMVELEGSLDDLAQPLKKGGIFTTTMAIEADNFIEGMSTITQVMKGMFFPPNVLFLTMSVDPAKDSLLENMIAISVRERLGLVLLYHHPKVSLGRKSQVNLWLRKGSHNTNLSILIALYLERNWKADIRLLSVERNSTDAKETEKTFKNVIEEARMSPHTEITILEGKFEEALKQSPEADINIFGVAKSVDCSDLRKLTELGDTSCLFVLDSGEESAWV